MYTTVTDPNQEGNTGEIVLQAADPGNNDPQDACDDSDAVKQMIMYIYKHEYEDKQTLMMHAKIFAMAIKYQILGLCKCAASKFEYLLDKTGDRPADDDLCRVLTTLTIPRPTKSESFETWSHPSFSLDTRDFATHLKAK